MPKRKRDTPKKAKKADGNDRLDAAEDLLVELLQHTADTTKHLESMLTGQSTAAKDDSIATRQEQFSTKTLKLHNILTQEYRRLVGGATTVAQSKHVLNTLDARLHKQQEQFFN